MATFFNFKRVYPLESEVLVADDPTTWTFSEVIDALVVYSTIDLWVSSVSATVAGNGQTQNARQFVAAGVQRVLPWNSDTMRFVNAVAAETADVFFEGWVQ